MSTLLFKGNYIDGRFNQPGGRSHSLVSKDPGDLDHPVGTFAFSEEDVDGAVLAAQKAFPSWSEKEQRVRDRAAIHFQKALKKRSRDLAVLISREMGKPIQDAEQEVARMIDRVPLARTDSARIRKGEAFSIKPGVRGLLRYKPRGVLGILGPFNFPAHLPNTQILAGILLGNSVVFKPSELTPFVGQFLAELWDEADLPEGVFNLIQGDGRVGRALAIHEGVQAILFTGSYATGQKIREETVHQPAKLVALEMGGKNGAIISRHVDLEEAVCGTLLGTFSMAGQRCNATSRILVEKQIAKRFLDRFMASVKTLKVGYSLDPDVFIGPLVSRRAVEKYFSLTALAPQEGFDVLQKAEPVLQEKKGYYVGPSVALKEVKKGETPAGAYTEEEIFGPNVAIYVVESLEEAVRLHNSSRYGLVASFFSTRKEEFEWIFRRLEVGLLNWNQSTTVSSALLPFGGLKQSGSHHPVGSFVPYLCAYPVAVIEKRSSKRKER